MSEAQILEQLRRLQPIAAGVAAARAQPPPINRALFADLDLHGHLPGLIEALRSHPALGESERRHVLFVSSWIPLTAENLALPLAQVAGERGPEGAMAWLDKVTSTKAAPARVVAEVFGIEPPEKPTPLAGLTIQSFASLPATLMAQRAAGAYRFEIGGPIPISPEVAVIARADVEFPLGNDPKMDEASFAYRDATDLIYRVVEFSTAASDGSPAIMRVWSEFEDDDFTRLHSGFGWIAPGETTMPFGPKMSLTAAVSEHVQRCLALNGPFRRRIEVASKHLSLARRRRDIGDKATEASICLESLLGDAERFDLTYKLSVRAALMAETELNRRLDVSSLVTDLYRLRGQVVHGKLAKHTTEDVKTVTDGIGLAAHLTRVLVTEGREPHWRTLELSGGAERRKPTA